MVELPMEERGRKLGDLRVAGGKAGHHALFDKVARQTVDEWAAQAVARRNGLHATDPAVLRALMEHRWYPETVGGTTGPWATNEVYDMRAWVSSIIEEVGVDESVRRLGLHGGRALHNLRIYGSARELSEARERWNNHE